jgi:hypothetical protein
MAQKGVRNLSNSLSAKPQALTISRLKGVPRIATLTNCRAMVGFGR